MNNSAADAHSPGMPFPARSITIRNGRRSSLSKEAEATAPSSHHRPLCRTWWCSFCNCCLSHPESSFMYTRPRPYAPLPSLHHLHPPQKSWGRQRLCSTHICLSRLSSLPRLPFRASTSVYGTSTQLGRLGRTCPPDGGYMSAEWQGTPTSDVNQ